MADTNNNSARKITIANIDNITMKQIPSTKWYITSTVESDRVNEIIPTYKFILRDSPSFQIIAETMELYLGRNIQYKTNKEGVVLKGGEYVESVLIVESFDLSRDIKKNIKIDALRNVDSFLMAVSTMVRSIKS